MVHLRKRLTVAFVFLFICICLVAGFSWTSLFLFHHAPFESTPSPLIIHRSTSLRPLAKQPRQGTRKPRSSRDGHRLQNTYWQLAEEHGRSVDVPTELTRQDRFVRPLSEFKSRSNIARGDDPFSSSSSSSTFESSLFNDLVNNGRFSPECERVAGDDFLSTKWRASKRLVCESKSGRDDLLQKLVGGGNNGSRPVVSRVYEYLLDHVDARPRLLQFENVLLTNSFTGGSIGAIGGSCSNPANTFITGEDGTKNRMTESWMQKELSKSERADFQHAVRTGGGENLVVLNSAVVLILVNRFNLGNPFEAFHSYLNFYLLKQALLLDSAVNTVMFAFKDTLEPTLRDDDFWYAAAAALSKQPLYDDDRRAQRTMKNYYATAGRDPLGRERREFDSGRLKDWQLEALQDSRQKNLSRKFVFAPRVIDASSSGISILVSGTEPLRGRGRDHNCPSSLFLNATRWWKNALARYGGLEAERQLLSKRRFPTRGTAAAACVNETTTTSSSSRVAVTKKRRKRRIEVVWVSRGVHPRAGGKLLHPRRVFARELDFLLQMREKMGPDIHLRVVDFGRLPSAASSVVATETADVAIGFHGAGLLWPVAFQGASALVEIFGDDRAQNNRHYHNAAKLGFKHHVSLDRGHSWRAQAHFHSGIMSDWWRQVEPRAPPLIWWDGVEDFTAVISEAVRDSLPWKDDDVRPRIQTEYHHAEAGRRWADDDGGMPPHEKNKKPALRSKGGLLIPQQVNFRR